MSKPARAILAASLALGLLLAACGQPASSSPGVTSSSSAAPGPVVVTFLVGDSGAGDGEEFRVLLTEPADIAIARQLLAGEEAPAIPNGRIKRDGDGSVNDGYSWHIDPADIEFADFTPEVCDGLPSYVEDGILTGDRFCPWSAKVIDIQPAP
jgi:hypothetical protein